MDRSFLSDPHLVAATRGFVCVRAATYEDPEEVPFLTSLFRGRSPHLENTVFALLAPDGKTRISNGGRSPQMAFRTDDNAEIVKRLQTVLADHEIKTAEAPDRLPFAPSLRLGLNLAACDNQALVLCLAEDAAQLRRIEKAVARHAWSAPFLGQFHYSSSNKKKAAAVIDGLDLAAGLAIIQPGRFGVTGTVLATHATGDASRTLDETLVAALESFDRPVPGHTMEHVRNGKRAGIHWKTATPITDSGGRHGQKDPPR